jgi:DNA polymerase-4/DNA polymerase V
MIAHIDVDAFFASVLVRKNPSLAGKPLLALGMGGGCVIAASYEAKATGVKTGMPLKEALTFCPNAIRIQSDFHEAALASEEMENILSRSCPLMEQMSIDEWYLDLTTLVGGLPRDPLRWAQETQATIERMTALTVSVGVGPTKLLAKMAGEFHKPAGATVIGQSIDREDFLRARPAAAIPGIGRKRVRHTEARGWKTAWDIAHAPTAALQQLFGKSGVEMQQELLGNALYGVREEDAPPKSVSRCRSFRPTKDRDVIWAHLLHHAEYTVMKMRRHNLSCKGISVWVRDSEYDGNGATASLPQSMNTTEMLLPFVQRCFAQCYVPNKAWTQVALALWNLVPSGELQFSLFENPLKTEQNEAIQHSFDILHKRFGRNSLTYGGALAVKSGTKLTIDMPVYE